MPEVVTGGEDLCDTGLQIRADGTAVSAIDGVSPRDNGTVLSECREGVIGGEDLRDTTRSVLTELLSPPEQNVPHVQRDPSSFSAA